MRAHLPTRRRFPIASPRLVAVGACLVLACAGNPDRHTLAELRTREPDLTEVAIDDGIDQAMDGYRKFLEQAPKSALTPEAMRRLADLKLEKQYGLLGGPEVAEARPQDAPAPDLPSPARSDRRDTPRPASTRHLPGRESSEVEASESDRAFEQRAAGATRLARSDEPLQVPGGGAAEAAGPLEAIALYDEILAAYPDYSHNDQVLYQKARAFDELGRVDEAIAVAALLVERYPQSRHLDEIQFRRAEYFFTRKKYFDAEQAYSAIISMGPVSDYYELALYKQGWTLYKQMMLEEALQSYVTLLDHKVTTGYDFDQTEDEAAEQRIADTYRVMSLCFSDLGGAEAVTSFFAETGARSYEDRVYSHLGEFYLEKLRYNDAASVYQAFIDLYPIHRTSPHFSMRVVEIYEAGNFPKLVLASKKDFAARYGLDSPYWQTFDRTDAPEVLAYLKSNLEDLANHYHALFQETERPEDKPAHFAESARWYRAFLASFPSEPETPAIHYQFADLLLENEDWSEAAREYERLAYEYPPHERSAQAGYAAIFAHRENEKRAGESEREAVRRETIASTLRFVDGFPAHEHAAAVLGAAIDDLYDLAEYASAISTGRRLIEAYPQSDPAIRRAAWTVVAHASFDTQAFEPAEAAYSRVLELTPEQDESRDAIVNNLAAAIYKQGEQANEREDPRAAADHFLRIARVAPLSEIRPIAEYDAGAALTRLEAWSEAATILESFRSSFPEHELNAEATRQVAFVYQQDGNLTRAAEEYERVAREAVEPELRKEALLVAADLYEEAGLLERAITVYRDFVSQFPTQIEPVVVARFKMSTLYERTGDERSRRDELRRIVEIDRTAGSARTDGVRLHAARAALILSEETYDRFAEIELTLPFETSLQRKKERMSAALAAFGGLVDYEVGEVTAAATFYMAEVYGEFSRALLASERPADLAAGELADYEAVLEEEAYPFEEKSIDVHEKNLELMAAGVFNEWIEKSLSRLAVVMPGRYAKFDASTGLLDSIRTYAYQTPSSLMALELAASSEAPVDDSREATEESSVASSDELPAEPPRPEDEPGLAPSETTPPEQAETATAESEAALAAPAALAPVESDEGLDAETPQMDPNEDPDSAGRGGV